MKTTPLWLYDGAKAVAIRDLPESAWRYFTPNSEQAESERTLYRNVPWLARGVDLRAKAVSSMPFRIYKGDTEVDNSDDYQNKLGFLPDPASLFYLIEASLTLLAKAYVFRETVGGRPSLLRWWHPSSVEPVLDPKEGLTGFERSVGNRVLTFDVEDVLYFWGLDPFVEIGPGENSPAQAALAAAGVLYSVDEFASLFFKRGAIKAMLLTVSGNTMQGERERVKKWWEKLFTGISNAWQTEVVNADAVKPVPIGEGIKELENTALTTEKREDISTALGIPQTMLFSQAANYATAQEDRLSFYKETAIPETEFLQRHFNAQVLEPLGHRLDFTPEALDVFQVDETERAQAFSLYVGAGLKKSIAAEMLGLDLPPGIEYADLDEEDEEEQTPAQLLPFTQPAGGNGSGVPEMAAEEKAISEAMEADLKRWQKKALSKGPEAPFTSEFIPVAMMDGIRAALAGATSEEEVKAVFAAPFRQARERWGWDYP